MADTNDTIDGLLAEFRGYSAGMPPSYHVTMSWHDFSRMLDRFDAAHRRDTKELRVEIERLKEERNYSGVRERERLRAKGFAIVPKEQLERGDAAKLREALGKIRAELWNSTVIAGKRKFELYEIADAALAAPSRNCDRFKTAAEAIDAYQDLTGDQLATDSGMKEWVEFAVWLFAPRRRRKEAKMQTNDKLREALGKILWCLEWMFNNTDDKSVQSHLIEPIALAKAALAEPPRNYEVGTMEELYGRYEKFCRSHFNNDGDNCLKCPFSQPTCKFAWAQMPYNEGGDK